MLPIVSAKTNLLTVSSTITPRKPLYSQLIGVSEPTLPVTVTTKGKTLHAASSNCAEISKKKIKYYLGIIHELVSR